MRTVPWRTMGALRANAAYVHGRTRGHHGESEDAGVYLTRLVLKNVRAFENLELSFTDGAGQPRMTNLVIGRNGTGKSTLLRCIVLGLASQAQANALRAEDLGAALVGPRGDSAEIAVWLAEPDGSNPTVFRKSIEKRGDSEVLSSTESEGGADTLVCAYGAGRATATGEDTGRVSIVETAYSLFNYEQSLNGIELTLRRLNDYLEDSPYKNVMRSVKRALSLSDADEIKVARGGGVVVTGPSVGNAIPLESWADGYRLSLGLILDIYAWAMRSGRVNDDGSVTTGILLVDEIEQHLHPALQASLAPEISNLFSDMQLIATTHSPLATMGVTPDEVVALRRDDNSVKEVDWLPDFADFSVDDVLAHQNLFATEPYGQDAAAKLARWRELASTEPQERTRQQDGELRAIARDFQQVRLNEEKSPLERALEELQQRYQF